MDIILQIWGGGFYLANKILLAVGENRPASLKRRLKLAGWLIYLLGVPAWVIILVSKQNWIAAAIEAGGVPSMLLGLYTVYTGAATAARPLDLLARSVTYVSLALGVGYSLSVHGGLGSVTQLLEIGVMVGFLLGSYFLARNQPFGWAFFMLMNISMSALMLIQGKPILSIQQLISLGFVCYGFIASRRTARSLKQP